MEIIIPEVGESVREALLAKWLKKNGELVNKDDALCEIETDKITLDIHANASGTLTIQVPEGTTVPVGAVVGSINALTMNSMTTPEPAMDISHDDAFKTVVSSPSIRRQIREQGIAPDMVSGTGKGGRITQGDLFASIEKKEHLNLEIAPAETTAQYGVASSSFSDSIPLPADSNALSTAANQQSISVRAEEAPGYNSSREERRPMSPIRRRISERMVAARQQTAILTTFNEADLSHVKTLREKYRDQFQKRHGAPLGLMPFFVKACVEALKEYPAVNASIDDGDLVYHNYYDIGIAIGAEKGLVVPVLRDADRMRLYEIDRAIAAFAEKLKTNQLSISELTGGTFSISNGGVYGSMLSTPILNIPQSGVLGMHAIQDRPVVRDGQVVIRPIMYLALSYDHRIVDGREAIGFLNTVKELIEDPEELLLEG